MEPVKRITIVRHLVEVIDEVERRHAAAGDLLDIVHIRSLWVAGALLDDVSRVGAVTVIVMIEEPADALPVEAITSVTRSWRNQLRGGKRPVMMRFDSYERPPWNHEHRRVAPVWSRADGTSPAVDDLRAGPTDFEISPTNEELLSFLRRALPEAEAHLDQMIESYWDPRWRREHTERRGEVHPDDHLWRAAETVRGMQRALAELLA